MVIYLCEVNGLKTIPLFLAFFIAFGHSLVAHSHEEPSELSIHHHEEHGDFFDLVACFFTVDHDSEDLENYLIDAGDSLPSGNYDVIPAIYGERPNPFVPEPHLESPYRDGPTLRGPPRS